VRVIKDKKIGFVETNNLTIEGLKKAVEDAEEILNFTKEDEAFVKLPEKEEAKEIKTFFEENLKVTPEDMAIKVKNVIQKASQKSLDAAGALSLDLEEYAVVNSRGIEVYQPYSSITLTTVMMGDDSSGYADRFSMKFNDLNENELADEAIEKL